MKPRSQQDNEPYRSYYSTTRSHTALKKYVIRHARDICSFKEVNALVVLEPRYREIKD